MPAERVGPSGGARKPRLVGIGVDGAAVGAGVVGAGSAAAPSRGSGIGRRHRRAEPEVRRPVVRRQQRLDPLRSVGVAAQASSR